MSTPTPLGQIEVIRTSIIMVLVTFSQVSDENQEIEHLIREPNFGKVTIVTCGGQVKVLMFKLAS